MSDILGAINNTVPISLFNRGNAGKVFTEVKKSGPKVVMRNNAPECVLMSPDEYVQMVKDLEDACLYALAVERMSHYDPTKSIPLDEFYEKHGINPDEIDDSEVEFE